MSLNNGATSNGELELPEDLAELKDAARRHIGGMSSRSAPRALAWFEKVEFAAEVRMDLGHFVHWKQNKRVERNRYEDISEKEVLRAALWTLRNEKSGHDWAREPMPQRNILHEQILAWERTWKQFTDAVERRQIRSFASCSELWDEAFKIYDEMGVMVTPSTLGSDNSSDDYEKELERLPRELVKASVEREWQRFLAAAARCDSESVIEGAHVLFKEAKDQMDESLVPRKPPTLTINDPPIGFGNRASGLEGTWKEIDVIGVGGNGTATLWMRTDQHDGLRQRMVVKDTEIQAEFHGMYQIMNEKNKPEPRELFYHRTLTSLQKSDAGPFVKYHGQALFYERHFMRSYMVGSAIKKSNVDAELILRQDHCEFGDLNDLIVRHLDPHNPGMDAIPIPPMVMWCAFEMLASAAVILASSSRKHFPAVHLDVKPKNVFVAAAADAAWPVKMLLGDFGLMHPVDIDDNPGRLINTGTRGWQAPEQIPNFFTIAKYLKITGAADMWSIGAIMISMMAVILGPKIITFDSTPLDQQNATPLDDFDEMKKSEWKDMYGAEMLDLIGSCVRIDPATRILPSDLLKAITKITREERDWFGDGDMTPMRLRKVADPHKMLLPRFDYVTGLSSDL